MSTASGKEDFCRAAGIFPIQAFAQQPRKIDCRLVVNCLANPLRYGVACRVYLYYELVATEVVAFAVQIGHEIQVVRKCPELCSAAKLELHSFIQIERLIES